MAWQLLTQVYGLDRDKLWVTYFGGSEALGLKVDEETREVWRMLGVPENRIVPLGMEDNFWEMGLSGPCGPCTEIHYNHTGEGGLAGATEVWNIVFMQFDRVAGGELVPLAVKHVDTGMGLERLTAILNMDNLSTIPSLYTTDVFMPLFTHIASVSGKGAYCGDFSPTNTLDWGYRVLADHARMLTVCLADGVFPDQNHKLKNVLRRAQKVSRDVFGVEKGLLGELSYKVVETLGEHHAELYKNHPKVLTILEFEDENIKRILAEGEKFKNKLQEEYPDMAGHIETQEACNFYESLKSIGQSTSIGCELAFKLYESHGMQKQDIVKIAAKANLEFDLDKFSKYFEKQKNMSKLSTALALNNNEEITFGADIPGTDDSLKYEYVRSTQAEYKFPDAKSSIIGLINSDMSCSSLREGERGVLLAEKTNFYSEAGGQVGDRGTVVGPGGSVFVVEDTQKLSSKSGHIAHIGFVEAGEISVDDQVVLSIDREFRLGCMRNHTATHLLNSVLNDVLPITCQRSSYVSKDYFKFDFSIFNMNFDNEMVKRIEEKVSELVDQDLSIGREVVSSDGLAHIANLITLPGEVYPREVSLIDTFNHVEPCCGTHLQNSKDVGCFVITGVKTPTSGVKSVRGLTGLKAEESKRLGQEITEEVKSFKTKVEMFCGETGSVNLKEILSKIDQMQKKISHPDFPFLVSVELSLVLDQCKGLIKVSQRAVQKGAASEQMKVALADQSDVPYFCHYLALPGSEKFTLGKAVKMVPKDKPCIIFSKVKGELKGKAVVPKDLVTPSFNAELWLDVAASRLEAKTSAPRGQDSSLNCNMAGVMNIEEDIVVDLLEHLKLFIKQQL